MRNRPEGTRVRPRTRWRLRKRATLFGALAFLGSCIVTEATYPLSVRDVETLLSRTTPPGSSHAQVSAALDSLGVEHGAYRQETRMLYGIWRATRTDLVCQTSIRARFVFDEGGRLIRSEPQEVYVCL